MGVIEVIATAILMLIFIIAVMHMFNGTFQSWVKSKFTVA